MLSQLAARSHTVARRIGTRVPKQNRYRRAVIHIWHPGAVTKGAPAVKKGTRVMYQFLRRNPTDDMGPGAKCKVLLKFML